MADGITCVCVCMRESLHGWRNFCVTLPRPLKISVEICWLGGLRGKSGVDRWFGWCNHMDCWMDMKRPPAIAAKVAYNLI